VRAEVTADAAGSRALSVVAESQPLNVWVGLLARRCRTYSAAASPSPAGGRVVDQKQRPRSQWRDRAGLAPDFPVMPVVDTQTEVGVISRCRRSRQCRATPCVQDAFDISNGRPASIKALVHGSGGATARTDPGALPSCRDTPRGRRSTRLRPFRRLRPSRPDSSTVRLCRQPVLHPEVVART
jgi:hypothetical protein